MKRSLIIVFMLSTVLLFTSCGSKSSKNNDDVKVDNTAATQITVSCAGDCTLASDANFSGGTFEDVLSANKNDYSYFFKNVKSIFENDDLSIVNLEGTLSENGSRADKTYAFRGKPEYVQILKDGSVEAVTLANNHSVDYGEVSLSDTKETLEDAGIKYAIGTEVAMLDVKGVNVALIGLYQLDESADDILKPAMEQASDADLKIIQIHWGEEKATEPNEEQVNLAHRAIDLGADLVIGHHPHVLQGVEKYKGKYICYSLGNFCFGGNPNPSDTDTMIFKQTFSFKEGMVAKTDDYSIVPCSITSSRTSNNYQPTPLTGEEKTRVEEKIKTRSKKVGDGNLDLKFE